MAALQGGGAHFVEAVDALFHLVGHGDDARFAACFEIAQDDAVVAHVVDFVGVEHDKKFDLG